MPLDTNTSIIIIITIVIIVFITIKLIIDLRQHPRQSASCSSKVKDVEGYDVLVAALLNQVILQLRWEFQFIFKEMLREAILRQIKDFFVKIFHKRKGCLADFIPQFLFFQIIFFLLKKKDEKNK